jgi:hypothetical protein
VARDGVVVPLVDGGQGVVVLFADVVDFLDLFGIVIGEAEAPEGACFIRFVDAGERVGDGDGGVGRVDVAASSSFSRCSWIKGDAKGGEGRLTTRRTA